MNSKSGTGKKNAYWLNQKVTIREIFFAGLVVICLMPFVSPPLALLLGVFTAQLIGNPFPALNGKATHLLLQFSVVGLGFGMDANQAYSAGKEGFLFAVASIFGVLLLGYLLGKVFRIDPKTSFLISSGTAICGGSAIAAVSPVIGAEEKQISVALGTIFILNSIALFLFPAIGQMLELSQSQFGIWSAVAIQDTSSVVGAASKYGKDALQIATTVKLTRALWIIPVALLSARIFKSGNAKVQIPYFIGYFVLAIILNTYVPFVHLAGDWIVALSKTGLTLTLFLIGSGLSKELLKSVGLKPVLQGVLLWIAISAGALWAVLRLV